jgi:large subunit ribosomal protein L18
LPNENRINGSHISQYAAILKEDKNKYEKQFSKLFSKNINPEEYPQHFEEVKTRISAGNFN